MSGRQITECWTSSRYGSTGPTLIQSPPEAKYQFPSGPWRYTPWLWYFNCVAHTPGNTLPFRATSRAVPNGVLTTEPSVHTSPEASVRLGAEGTFDPSADSPEDGGGTSSTGGTGGGSLPSTLNTSSSDHGPIKRP